MAFWEKRDLSMLKIFWFPWKCFYLFGELIYLPVGAALGNRLESIWKSCERFRDLSLNVAMIVTVLKSFRVIRDQCHTYVNKHLGSRYLVDNRSAIWIVCILVIRKIKQIFFHSIFEYTLIQIMHSIESKKITKIHPCKLWHHYFTKNWVNWYQLTKVSGGVSEPGK